MQQTTLQLEMNETAKRILDSWAVLHKVLRQLNFLFRLEMSIVDEEKNLQILQVKNLYIISN